MQQTLLRAGALGLLCAALHSQSHTVSPASATAAEGNANNTIPWWSATHRYQQIHGDVRGNAWLVQGLALRRDGLTGSGGPARTIDAEIFMGNADYATATGSFLGNYTGTRAQVVNRKQINLPDFTAGQGSPAPFALVIPFDTPWPYTGAQDLAWELLVHSTTSSSTYVCDAHSGLASSTNTSLGTGCLATGKSVRMTLSATFQTTADIVRFGWTATNCPDNSLSLVVLGHTNPSLPVPGLCTSLYAMPLLVFPGIASGGTYTIPVTTAPFDPSLGGAVLYSQAFSDDPGQSGLPLAGSQGLQTTLGNPPPFRITRIWINDVNAASGSRSEFYPYGLVTRFTHQ
jgi:hypothetical protein